MKKGLLLVRFYNMDIKLPNKIKKEFIYTCMGFGMNEPDIDSIKLVEGCSKIILESAQPKAIYKIFPIFFKYDEDKIYILNEKNILSGKSILKHLEGCSQCVLMAITLGQQIDKIIRKAQLMDMAKAIALDACASSLIEDLCDQVNEQITEELMGKGQRLTTRFSPGYGDLPLYTQKIFSNLLDMERKIGLTKSSEYLLLPRKSITAIIGIKNLDENLYNKDGKIYYIENEENSCDICLRKEQCEFRKNGGHCLNKQNLYK